MAAFSGVFLALSGQDVPLGQARANTHAALLNAFARPPALVRTKKALSTHAQTQNERLAFAEQKHKKPRSMQLSRQCAHRERERGRD